MALWRLGLRAAKVKLGNPLRRLGKRWWLLGLVLECTQQVELKEGRVGLHLEVELQNLIDGVGGKQQNQGQVL